MRILFEQYDPVWQQTFDQIKVELINTIGFVHPRIEHIGSTSVVGLSAKPIIDILIGVADEKDLDKTTQPLMDKGYVYYEKYNDLMPYRRFFVKHKVDPQHFSIPILIGKDDNAPNSSIEHDNRLAHIHVIPTNSEHWTRHIAFRDYLRTHPEVKEAYQRLKEYLSTQEWNDGNHYNEGKNDFIKQVEQDAVKWYSGAAVQ